MKQAFTLILMLLVIATANHSYAQAPQSFKYQSIARDGAGILIVNANIRLKIKIHDLIPSGQIVYEETHQVVTNGLGLFTISVGSGENNIGSFSEISWSTGGKFIEVLADFENGTNFVSMGTSQLLSVPYALHSESGWGLTGNSGTTNGTNFIGTLDDRPLTFKVNNEIAGVIGKNEGTFYGYLAGGSFPESFGSTAFGHRALYSAINAGNNTAIGFESLTSNTTGIFNSAFGFRTLNSNLTGYRNTAVGYEALMSSTGNTNTAIGFGALSSCTDGGSNTAIGSFSNVSSGSLTNATAIGNEALVNASNKVRIGNGAVTVVEVPVAVTIASDARLKDNIAGSELGLEFITRIRPVQYTMKTGNGKTDYGFIAQELKEVLGDRNVNMLNKDGEYYHVRYNDLIAPMVKAIQEQQQLINQLKAELNAMKSELESKAAENTALKSTVEDRLKRLEAAVVANTQN